MTFLLRRGPGALRRVAHIAHFNGHGEIDRAWCGRTDLNLSSNVPWGRPRCKNCLSKMSGGSTTRSTGNGCRTCPSGPQR